AGPVASVPGLPPGDRVPDVIIEPVKGPLPLSVAPELTVTLEEESEPLTTSVAGLFTVIGSVIPLAALASVNLPEPAIVKPVEVPLPLDAPKEPVNFVLLLTVIRC